MKTKMHTQITPRVVIVGGGFGGLHAARSLAKLPVRVTLLDRNNYHLFQPLLYQVATAGISPTDVAYPLRSIFRRQKNLEFRMAEVTDIDPEGRILTTTSGTMPYDYLVLAVGGQTNTFNNPSVAANSFPLKNLTDASEIRDHLLRIFEQASVEKDTTHRQDLLTFVIAGGGPTGVEMAGAISELIRLVLTKDYPQQDFSQARVLLLEAGDRLLPAMPPPLQQATITVLENKGVEVRLGAAVESYDGEKVQLRSGESISTRTLVWAAGIRAADLIYKLGAVQAAQGRVKIDPTLQLPGHPEVYIIGDAAFLEDEHGQPLPMLAPVAMQQGDLVGKNIRLALEGKAQINFHYKDPGTMATIGRNQAVAWIGPVKLTGFLAWVTWLVVHIYQLIGFRNRLLVLINWAWDYFFFDRAVRLIIPKESGPKVEQSPIGPLQSRGSGVQNKNIPITKGRTASNASSG